MSLSDAIGQIDQIVQWEQQLSNPAALTQTTSSAAATAQQVTGTAAGGSPFADALAQAQNGSATASLLAPTTTVGSLAAGPAGITGSTGSLLAGGGSQLLAALSSSAAAGSGSAGASTPATGPYAPATGPTDPRVAAMVQEADSLVGKPYIWGGGHNNFGPQAGYDCSGFVSAVLHAGGYLGAPQDTTTLPSAPGIEQGPGQYVTIYDRDAPGQEGHVIIEINGQFYESGGEQGTWGGGGGVEKISTPTTSYLATFNQVLHPAGL